MAELRKIRMVNTKNNRVRFFSEGFAASKFAANEGWVREEAEKEVTFKAKPGTKAEITEGIEVETELPTEEKTEKPVIKRRARKAKK